MKKFLPGCLIILLLSGCTSSYITSTWKAPGAKPGNYSKVLVVALIPGEERAIQEKMEQHMVGDLKDLGYTAVSSLQEYGPKAFKNMSEEEVINKVRDKGIDAVITIVLLNKDLVKRYYPGHPRFYASYSYNRGFARYYNTMYMLMDQPAYFVVNTQYSWESNLYDLQKQDLLYSVQTESFDPVSIESMGHEYGKMIIKSMTKKNILSKQKQLKAF